MLYHIPKLSDFDFGVFRSPGPGLGNLLLPISRALIGREIEGGKFVYPTMRQLKIGTYIRREPDKRTYGDIFRKRSGREWGDWARSCFAPGVCESSSSESVAHTASIVYSGLGQYFHDLVGYHELVKNWIETNAILNGELTEDYDIGVLVRLGDYPPFVRREPDANVRLPLRWFLDGIQFAKELIDEPKPKVVFFSDAHPREIASLMESCNGSFNPGKNAVTDLLNLSRAHVIVASRSTFAMWATFISNSYAVWDDEYNLERCFPVREDRDYRIPIK